MNKKQNKSVRAPKGDEKQLKIEVREDIVFISGYINAVERLSKPITEIISGQKRTFRERIQSGTFAKALKRNKNVPVLLNHNHERILALSGDGTAVLTEDNIGLRAELTIRDPEVVQKGREGKLNGWSFGFVPIADKFTFEGDTEIRSVFELDLVEVSILDDTKNPAYSGTSIEVREGGAKVMEIRVVTREEHAVDTPEKETTLSVEELATAIADKVIEKLKPEEKFEEPTGQPSGAEGEPGGNPNTKSETDPPAEPSAEEEKKDEERSIDYSDFEKRLENLKNEGEKR